MYVRACLFQIWSYVELSEKINYTSEKKNTSDDSRPFYMWHNDVQMTICEKGQFPSKNPPPGCSK